MYSEKKQRLETAKHRLAHPPKKKKKRKPPKVIVTVDDEEESDEEKFYTIKKVSEELCQPQVQYNFCNLLNKSINFSREIARNLIL